uniref:Variant surface glycoprotein 1680 n=1 Tax=Trypanosoma brucei TaxID=5691 RepID=M4SWZ0_9TRYP|nr:variant surface glycoprotein 1680 [Trypanosoma brucei]
MPDRQTTKAASTGITFILTTVIVATAANEGIKHTLWGRHCKLARNVRSTSKAAVAEVTAHANSIRNLRILSLRLKIYALLEGQAHQETAKILAAATAEAAGTLQEETLPKATAAIKGASYGHAASALITGFYEMLESMNNANTAYCLTGATDGTDAAGSIHSEGCAHTSEKDFTAGAVHDSSALTNTGFAGATAIETLTGKSTQQKCGFFAGTGDQQTAAGFPTTTPRINQVKIINGLFKLNAASDPTTPDMTNVGTALGGEINKFWKDLPAATKTYFAQQAVQPTEVSKQTLIALGSKTSVEKHIRSFLAAANGTSPQSAKGNIDAE